MKTCSDSFSGEIFLFHQELETVYCALFTVNKVYCLAYIFCETPHGLPLATEEIASVGLEQHFSSWRGIRYKEERKPKTS